MNKLNTIQRFRKQFALHPFIWIGAKDPEFGTAQEKVEQFILQEQNRLLDEVLRWKSAEVKRINESRNNKEFSSDEIRMATSDGRLLQLTALQEKLDLWYPPLRN